MKPEPGKRVEFRDTQTTGLCFRISPKGRKAWSLVYNLAGGHKRRWTIGPFPNIGLDDARKLATKALGRVAEGHDPAGEKSQSLRIETVKELGAQFIVGYAKPNKRSWKGDEDNLRLHVYPAIGSRRIDSIKPADIASIMDGLVAAGKITQANRVRSLLSKLYEWADQRGYVDMRNPAQRIDPLPEKSRDHVLSLRDIKTMWDKLSSDLDEMSMRVGASIAFRLALVTLQRRSEIAYARFDEMDLETRVWTLTSTQTKNKTVHLVPLSRMALELIEEARQHSRDSEYLFPSPTCGVGFDGPIAAESLTRAMTRNRARLGVPSASFHDLRRTGRTLMTSEHLGIAEAVAERILNHVPGNKLTRTYDRNSYLPEKRRAMDAWGAFLFNVVNGNEREGKIIPLKTA